jgi:hypothetical protein
MEQGLRYIYRLANTISINFVCKDIFKIYNVYYMYIIHIVTKG